VLAAIVERMIYGELEGRAQVDIELTEKDEVPVVTFADGGQIVEIFTEDALAVEGSHMRHCIGKPEHGHPRLLHRGAVRVFSYRDPTGMPKATLEVSTSSHRITDLEGPHNGPIHDDVARVRMAWLVGPALLGHPIQHPRLSEIDQEQLHQVRNQITSQNLTVGP
jgi:hypothetical protein